MYRPDEIIERAAKSYPAYLRSLITGDNFFPLAVGFGKATLRESDFDTLRREFAALRESRRGFTVEWVEKTSRQWGRQQFPDRICFETAERFLASIGKTREVDRFNANVQVTRRMCPELEGWLRDNVMQIVENGDIWPDLLKVCRYFLDNPRPQRFARELPIAIDTKFIERNSAIISTLLRVLIPDSVDLSADTFEKRFGLLSDSSLIRFRVLDESLLGRLNLVFSDLSVPVEQFANWDASGTTVLIVENKMNFLTLPALANTIGVWGSGNAVVLLAECSWLKSCRIIYWGDIDVSGFVILGRLRSAFPHVESVLMDQTTLERFLPLALPGMGLTPPSPANLSENELAAFNRVMLENLKIEQEKLPHDISRRALLALISGAE